MLPGSPWLQLSPLLDALDDVLAWVKDRQGRYRWVNRAFQVDYAARALDQRPASDPAGILGKTDYDLSPSFLADQFRLDDEQVLAGKRIVNRIELVGHSDGPAAWHVTNKIPLFNRSGRIIGTAGITRPWTPQDGSAEPGWSRILAHIRDHYSTSLTNQHLASVAHMSLRAFERKFLRSFHLTPQQYLRKLRMRMASRALVAGNASVAHVAQRCGYSDQSHFTREFRRHFGKAPRQYREHYLRAQDASNPSLRAPATARARRTQTRAGAGKAARKSDSQAPRASSLDTPAALPFSAQKLARPR